MRDITCPICKGTNTRIIWTVGVVERCRYSNKPTDLSPPSDDNLRLRCEDCGREIYVQNGLVLRQGDRYDLLDHVEDRGKVVLTVTEIGVRDTGEEDVSAHGSTQREYEDYDPDDDDHKMAVKTDDGYYLIEKRRPDGFE